jgi:tetratricopeptide (TPR) repeat protein
MAIYNRAILNEELRNYREAIADLDLVMSEYPYFVPGYYFRSEIKRAMSDAKGADQDSWYAFDLEQKLKKEKEKGKIITGKGIFEPSTSTEGETEANEKNTRERSDKNIEKFNRLVMYDKEEEIKSSYKNEIRGRVQDRQIKVDYAPQFVITYYEKSEDIDKSTARFDRTISDYNALMFLKLQLKAINKEAALADQQASYHFQSIDEYSLIIDREPDNADAYFGRALDFMVLQDLTEALNDFSYIIKLRPDFILAYFNRAVVRFKLMQIENYDEHPIENDVQNLSLNIQNRANSSFQSTNNPYIRQRPDANNSQKAEETRRAFEYEQIIQDYDKVIQLNPDFVYAYYNRANIRCYQRDFRQAVLDYNEAINRNPEFAEAYFNRGLTRLFLGDTQRGTADLSKAGELGIVEAYGIIKKMSAE